MKKKLFLIYLVSCFAVGTAFAAPRGNTAESLLRGGWESATDMLSGVVSPEQHRELNVIAYSAAVSNLCPDFELDRKKFAEGMKKLEHKDITSMSPEETQYFEHQLLVHYGVAVGLFLSEGSIEKQDFCKTAEQHRNDSTLTYHYWEADSETEKKSG